jgi:hypothetical protein
VCALTVVLNLVLGAQLRGQADALLRTRAAAAAATVGVDANGNMTVREPPNDAALDAGIWIFQSTHVIQQPSASLAVSSAVHRLAGSSKRFTNVGRRSAVRLYAQPIRKAVRRSAPSSQPPASTLTSERPDRRCSRPSHLPCFSSRASTS